MARDDDKYKAGVDFEWVTAKGSNYKTRKFFTKAEKEAMKAPKKESKAASKPASAAPTKSIRPKAKTTAASKPTTGLTDSQRTSLISAGGQGIAEGGFGLGGGRGGMPSAKKRSRLITTNTKPKSAVSGASSGTDNNVKPKGRTPVPGMAIVTAIKNAFTGNGATDAAKISSSGNINLGRKPKPAGAKVPAGPPNRADVIKKKKK